MDAPINFYNKEKESFEKELALIKKKLASSSVFRLIVACTLIFAVYYFFIDANIVIPIVVGGIAFFIFLVSKHSDLNLKKNKLETLIVINQTEIDVLQGDLSKLETGNDFQDSQHAFSYDIDLFGRNSFFQYVNRTVLASGKQLLAHIITSNTTEAIQEKQVALKELSEKIRWRQNFSATGKQVNVEIDSQKIQHWLKNHEHFVPSLMRILPTVFAVISVTLFILNYFAIIPLTVTTTWFFIGLGITGIYVKKINIFYQNASKAKDTFRQYHQLLKLIETEKFSSGILLEKQKEIKSDVKAASAIFLEFSKLLDAFDQRNNMMVGVFTNAFALRDLQLCYKIENWITSYEERVAHWFEVIAFFDAYNSLANYTYNHPSYTFPLISEDNSVITATNLGHPLIDSAKRIDNDIRINNEEFFIVTGANMAGKSTFLRTVSLSIIMANSGLPVCAKSFSYTPIKLITSMRTSDSLSDDESYFFSELKRLKFIIDEIDPKGKAEKYFIILDEILKGTNSLDKAIGSRKFVERLVKSQSTGIIATHDLSLCEISDALPQVKNHYFDAEIIADELHFDYRFKDGICKNMNASFLLKKMDIV
ncbi:MutS-related protein [Ulvibacter antarcticus]|uniref:MutS-like protein n=1 Tax=Ulvibacter antarcticus TaxID=442714 RepID=A0A3L9Z1N7_9FLAO|nr:DNA mismatch repair protein MutS [Ulvibacter antarcticus]RMA66444.1 MutS-like protein [Ulvibacter antarcticus]